MSQNEITIDAGQNTEQCSSNRPCKQAGKLLAALEDCDEGSWLRLIGTAHPIDPLMLNQLPVRAGFGSTASCFTLAGRPT